MNLLTLIAKWFKNTGFLSILVFVFLTVFLIHLFAQGGLGPNIEFDGVPWITGPSGTYTTATLPQHLYISIKAKATGFGDVTLSLTNINVTDQPLKSISSSGTEIGRMRAVFGVPFSAAATYSYSSHGYAVPTSTTAKTYNWSASGTVKLTPYAWEWGLLGGRNITGSWVAKTNLAKTESAAAQSGSWVVTTSTGSGSGTGSSNGSGPGCSKNPRYNNWCTDTGACTTRSPLGVAGECGHNYCCCAPAGSPTYNGNSNPPSTPSTPTSSTPDSDSADSSGSDSSDSSGSDSSDGGSTFVGCGHTPSHTTVNFWGCGHSGFRCKAGDHGFVYCPTSDGKTCTVRSGVYQKCSPHTHTYD